MHNMSQAATQIQKHWKGRLERKQMNEYKSQLELSWKTIYKYWKKHKENNLKVQENEVKEESIDMQQAMERIDELDQFFKQLK